MDSEREVMKVHCELLGGEFDEKSTTVSTTDVIKSMVGGNAAHRAGALKLALRNGRSKGGTHLRCPVHDCDFHDNPVSCRSLGSNLTCPSDHWRGPDSFMECAHCGESRSDTYTRCQGCGKHFI